MSIDMDNAEPNTNHSENRRLLKIPSYNVKKMNVELSEDPWRPMAMKRRHSDTVSSFASNGHIERVPSENGGINFCEKEKSEEDEGDNVRTYKRRFYILFVFSLSSFAQYCAWNAFGPISGTTKAVFGWGNAEIALLASLDPITYILTIMFFSWLMDVKGLRISLALSVFLMFIGVGIRCVTRDHDMVLWTMTIGQFLNGLGGPVVQAGAPLLSSAWFPHKERTTATAIASLCGSLGVALSFLIGPNMVGDVGPETLPTLSEFSGLSSNYSFLANNLYLNKSLPLSETLFKDAVHYWPIGNFSHTFSPRGTQLIKDHKGHMRGHVVHKVNYVPGPHGTALQTDGKSGYVILGNFINTCIGNPTLCSKGMSVSMWIKYASSDEVQYFLGTSNSQAGQPGFVVYQDPGANGSDYLAVSVRTGSKSWTSRVGVPSDTWTHLLFTWSPREGLAVHANGTLAGTSKQPVATLAMVNHRTSFTLGRANNEYRLSAAAYDDLSVWYHVLTDKEVKAIYARMCGIDFAKLSVESNQARKELLKVREDEIMRLMYIEFAVIAVLFFCILVYFPDRPPTPPSISASTEREDFSVGFKQLLRHKQFWTLTMIYGITTGIYSGWGAVLALNLEGFGIGQLQASWIGFYSTVAGIVAGISLARFSDYFGGRLKTLLLFLFVCSSAAFLLFSLLCLKIIPFSEASLYPSSIIGGFSISGTIPLFYELTVECTYPIAEGVTTGILTLINNIWTFAFLLVVMIPGIGTIWMNWCLFASCIGCIPVLLCLKERYGRLVVDNGIEVKVTSADDEDEEGFKEPPKSIFSSTLSITRVDQMMERLYKSKESKL